MIEYKKISLIFPGQGSQYIGMGKDLYDKYESVKDIYNTASNKLGYDIKDICFKKHILKSFFTDVSLDKTIFTQPAILTTSYACFKALEEECKENDITLNPFLLMGHSLGEYTALVVSGAIDFENSLELVKKRATYMSEAGKNCQDGGLTSILSRKELNYENIKKLCNNYETYIALINTQKQIVVGGPKKRLAALSKDIQKDDIITKDIRVEGPFHTPIIKSAADKFKKELINTNMYIASTPVIVNVTARAIADPEDIKEELYMQISNTVNWKGSVEKGINNDVDLFIEIGPKKVLSNMIQEINPQIATLNVEDVKSLEKTIKELKSLTFF